MTQPSEQDHYRNDTSPLGQLVHRYDARTPWRIRLVVWAFSPILLLGAVGLFALLFTDSTGGAPGDLAAVGVLAGILAALAIALQVMWWVQRGKSVGVFEQGLEYRHRKRVIVARWEEIRAVTNTAIDVRVNGIPTGVVATATFEGPAFGRIKLNQWFDGVAKLGADVERRLYPRMLADAKGAFERGERVAFGPLILTREGLEYGSKRLSWPSVNNVGIDGGYVLVRANEKMLAWAMIPKARVPNGMVLHTMIQGLLRR